MDKRFVSVAVAMALAFALVGYVAPVSHASHDRVDAIQQFMPDGDAGDKDQLTDAFDGSDSRAHLTVVAEDDATQVTWFVCPEEPVETPTSNDDANCAEIGTDSSGEQANDEHDDDIDKAFELFWDISSSFDTTEEDEYFDVIARACVGDPDGDEQDDGSGQGGVPENCRDDREQHIAFDDAGFPGGGGQDLPAGEIQGVCIDVDQHEDDADPCDPTDEDFMDAEHGSSVPRDEFIVYFRTGDDLNNQAPDFDDVWSCIDEGRNSTNEPGSCDVSADDVSVFDFESNYNEWNATYTGMALDNEFDLGIYADDENGDSGDLEGTECDSSAWNADTAACVLDEHYLVGVTSEIGPGNGEEFGVGITFEEDGDDDSECEDDREKEETGSVNNREVVIGCQFDQFERPVQGAMTFESDPGTSAGGFVRDGRDCADVDWSDDDGMPTLDEGTAHDHDNDDIYEHCHITSDEAANETGKDSEIALLIESDDDDEDTSDSGDQTITACEDEDDEIDDEDNPGHGCDNSEESDSAVMSWVEEIDHVHLFYAGTESDDCETGEQFRENRIQDTETLAVCVHDEDDNPVSTQPRGNGNLDWDIDSDSVTFTSSPPEETDGDGEATATIRGVEGGSAEIRVDVDDCDNCDDPDVAADTLRKFVAGPGTGQPAQCNNSIDDDGDGAIDFPQDSGCAALSDDTEESGDDVLGARRVATQLTIRYEAGAFRGRVRSVVAGCRSNRMVRLVKKRSGRDVVVGGDLSSRRGRWQVPARHPRGGYYATVRRHRSTNGTGVRFTCLSDSSPLLILR